MECRREVAPLIAGSRNSLLCVMEAKKKGDAWWMTVENGGVDWTALSKAPGTIAKSSCDVCSGKS